MFNRMILVCCLCIAHALTLAQVDEELMFTKGVYGDAGAVVRKGMSFRSLGVNAIFVRSSSLDDAVYAAAKKEGVKVYAEFPTLNGKEYLPDHPEAWPVNERGERAPAADWFMGICLTDPGFREFREQQLCTLLSRYAVDGVWLDYLHWHAQFETPDPILPETCFCERCLMRFGDEMRVDVPEGDTGHRAQWILAHHDTEWRQWRANVLAEWVSGLKNITKEMRPSARLGIYYCPWYPGDYNGAQYRVLGLDMKALSRIADVFSPMLYHHMMGRSPSWVGEYVRWLKEEGITDGVKPQVWPIVQAHNKPGVISPEEFRTVLINGSRAPSSGVMMFTLNTLLDDPAKLKIMREVYRER